jgi:hypothetical protein
MGTVDIKEMVKDGKRAKFLHYKLGELWYETEDGFAFPVPITDTGDGVFHVDEKAILLMRYIRKHIAYLKEARQESGWEPPYHVTGTDNPVDFPKGG